MHLRGVIIIFAYLTVTAAWQESQQPLRLPSSCQKSCDTICKVFYERLPDQIAFPSSLEYRVQQESYWSDTQSELQPCCRVTPNSIDSLGLALTLVCENALKFAIKGGGHSAVAGASNAPKGGITIDLSNFSGVEIRGDEVVVGPAATWGDVYLKLKDSGRTVVGGRVSSVGVGGLILGGGISYLSPRHGWACESVTSYEVMLSNGTLVTASSHDNMHLSRALKGSGSQYGVVTSFTLRSFEQSSLLYAQFRSFDENQIPGVVEAFTEYNRRALEDLDAYSMISIGFNTSSRTMMINANVVHAAGNSQSKALRPILSISSRHADSLFTDVSLLAEVGTYSNPKGLRHMQGTITIDNNAALTIEILYIWHRIIMGALDLDGKTFFSGIGVEAITQDHLRHGNGNDGTVFGLNDEEGPLILLLIDIQYRIDHQWDADDYFGGMLQTMIAQFSETARRYKNGLKDFVYLPYAASFQRPIESYGAEAVKLLKEVQHVYDPRKGFTRLSTMPQGFKV